MGAFLAIVAMFVMLYPKGAMLFGIFLILFIAWLI
tara:strand:- start:85 stop:189 length:105 start_codon:yes stop_codon:yes gene_type:complete